MSTPVMIDPIDITRMTDPDIDETCVRLNQPFRNIILEPVLSAVQGFQEKGAFYSDTLKQRRISVRTEDIQLLERNRDRSLTEVFHANANELLSTAQATREAAHQVDVILRDHGNPAHRPMDTQTNIVRDIIAEVTAADMAPYLAELPVVNAVVARLKTLNDEFSRLFTARIAEHDHREKGVVRRTRKELEAALRLLIDKINAYILLFGDEGLADIVAAALRRLWENNAGFGTPFACSLQAHEKK